MNMRRVVTGYTLCAFVVATMGCGSGSRSADSNAVLPNDAAAARAAEQLIAPFGLQVQRASVGEKAEPRGGTELSVYVRPTRTETADAYANRMMALSAAVVPALYAMYPGIDWIDLCQEPAKSSGAWETVPVTRLEISRAGSGRLDWERKDLAQLLAWSAPDPLEYSIGWHNGVGQTRVWRDAAARAKALAG